MIKYTFILNPLKPFFFGGEKSTFDFAEYYMQSRYFPQQTAVLGLVREHILGVTNLLGKTRTEKIKCDKYIGEESFNGTFNQGAINAISPVQIAQLKNDTIEQVLLLSKFNLTNLKIKQLPLEVHYGLTTTSSAFSFIEDYDAKKADMIEDRFCDNQTFEETKLLAKPDKTLLESLYLNKINDNGVFISTIKVGNTKNYAGNSKDNKDGFYKQKSFDLNKNYVFTFEVEIEDSVLQEDLSVKNKIMRFGGRASLFSLTVLKDKPLLSNKEVEQSNCFLLTSDAFVSNEIYNHISCSITDTTTFRHALTSNAQALYNKPLNRYKNGANKYASERKCLLSRGSILVSDDVKATIKNLENTDYKKLGYNHFIQF